jgi:hypothetical protein
MATILNPKWPPKYKNPPIWAKGVGVIRVDFGPISETVYIDIILNTIIER